MALRGWRAFRIALALVAILGVALAVTPLLGVVGFESALLSGFLGSLVVGLCTAGLAARARTAPVVPSAAGVFVRALGVALVLGLVPLAILSANALRVPNCNWAEGLAFWAVVALPSLLVAAAWGATFGLAIERTRRARLAFFAVWLGSFAWALGRFWSTPAVQGFDPFFGWFPGTLYDAVVAIRAPLWSFRAGTVLEIAALGLLCRALSNSPARIAPGIRASPAFALALVCVALRAGIYAYGPELGHRTNVRHLRQTLGVVRSGPRCTVVADGTIPPGDVARFLEDCEFQLGQVERFFAARGPSRVTAFLFRDEGQKGKLLGAAETFVAKPWRREVYLQAAGFPHPVLEHEIAHVVAGSFARAPFRVAARAGGLWPVPGLIEGAAVAAGWERDELTPHQWSRAMRDAGMRPSPARSLGLSFLWGHAGTAYTVAGSFSRFLVERHGPARFREAYRLGDVEAAYGRPLAALEREWNEFLEGVVVSPLEAEVARYRFDRPSLFGQVCAREVARLSREAQIAADAGDVRRAIRAIDSLCRHDPANAAHRVGLFEMLVRSGRAGRAREVAAGLERDAVGLVLSGQIEERLADLEWMAGRTEEAARRYRDLAARAPSEDQRRMRLVKAAGAADPAIGPSLRRFLLGDHAQPEASPLGIETLHALLTSAPGSALGEYLLGRQLFNQQDFERAAPRLARAIDLGLSDEPIDAEARRVLGISLYRTGRVDEARRAFEALAAMRSRPEGARDEATSWVRRCRWARGPGRTLAAAER